MEKKHKKFILNKDIETLFNMVSLCLMVFTLYYMSFGINHELKNAIYIFYVIASIILQIMTFFRLGDRYIFDNTMQIGKKYLFFIPTIVCVLGLCELIIQYITMNTLHQPINIFNSIIAVPVIVLSLNCYLRNMNQKYEFINYVGPKINLTAIRLVSILALSFICALWGSYERNNFSIPSLLINLVYEWLSMVVILIQCIYMVMALLYAAKNKNTIQNLNYKFLFPYMFFLSGGIMIIAWGSVSIFSATFIFEKSYLIATFIYIELYLFCIYIIPKKIGCRLKRDDIVKAVVSNVIILLNYFWVDFNAANNITGDYITIIVEVISLIGCVAAGVYVIKKATTEEI